jgi:hypothetical protein
MERSYPVITPKKKDYIKDAEKLAGGACARADYEKEMNLLKKNSMYEIMWDDAPGNPTRHPGGLFGFTHFLERVEWFLVTGVRSSTDRQPWWSAHVGHRDRNVLVLSNKLYDMSWSEFVSCLEYDPYRVRGTQRIVNPPAARKKIWDCVQRHSPFIFCSETGEIIYKEHNRTN